MAAPTLELCADLATALTAAWNPSSPDGVEWHFFKRIGDADTDSTVKLTGRRVVIFPTGYETAAETRGEDRYTHRVGVLVVERYTDAGDPTRDWIKTRVDFVHDYVVAGFDFWTNGPPSWNRKLLTESATVQVCDLEKLVGGQLFYSLVEIVFTESV